MTSALTTMAAYLIRTQTNLNKADIHFLCSSREVYQPVNKCKCFHEGDMLWAGSQTERTAKHTGLDISGFTAVLQTLFRWSADGEISQTWAISLLGISLKAPLHLSRASQSGWHGCTPLLVLMMALRYRKGRGGVIKLMKTHPLQSENIYKKLCQCSQFCDGLLWIHVLERETNHPALPSSHLTAVC